MISANCADEEDWFDCLENVVFLELASELRNIGESWDSSLLDIDGLIDSSECSWSCIAKIDCNGYLSVGIRSID